MHIPVLRVGEGRECDALGKESERGGTELWYNE